jgi:hypothetical protein
MLASALTKRQNIHLNRADIKNEKQATNTQIISLFERGLKVGIDLSTFGCLTKRKKIYFCRF